MTSEEFWSILESTNDITFRTKDALRDMKERSKND